MNMILIPAIAVVVAIVGGRMITKVKESREKNKKTEETENASEAKVQTN